jgi:agmatinase
MDTFLGVSEACCAVDKAGVLILPVPYEGTVTYGKGTGGGPQAVIDASQHVELYDEYLDSEPWRQGIATLPALHPRGSAEEMVQAVDRAVSRYVKPGRLVVTLGGEHSISSGAVAAHLETYPDMGVIQLDAHADLRDTYDGTSWNHACVMARIRELVPPSHVLQLGIRSLSAEEAALAGSGRYSIVPAHEIIHGRFEAADCLRNLPGEVYITLDVDVFDPSVIRATGTPEPGGLDWYALLDILEQVFATKRVVGFDVVELSVGDDASAYTTARLIYRMIGLWASCTERS